MNSLNKLWSKSEKPVIYVTLGIYLLLQLLMIFIPRVDKVVKENPEIMGSFISIILIYLFLFIDRRLPVEASESIKYFDRLISAIDYAYAKQPSANKIDILGHSTQTFYASISDRLHESVDLRVLLRNPDSSEFLPHIKDRSKVDHEKRQIGNAVTIWKDVAGRNKIKSLKMYYYDFEPSFYLMALDSKVLVLGILEPSQDRWGFRRGGAFVIDGRSEIAGPLVRNFISWLAATIAEKCTDAI